MLRTLALSTAFILAIAALTSAAAADGPAPLTQLEQSVPKTGGQFTQAGTDQLIAAADQLYEWAVAEGLQPWTESQPAALARVKQLTATKRRVDELLDEALALRTSFAAMPSGPEREEHARQFLRASSKLIDLSGRLRYTLRDVIDRAAYVVESNDHSLAELIDTLRKEKSTIGLAVLAYLLEDPADPTIRPVPSAIKRNLLAAIVETRQSDLLPQLAAILSAGHGSPKFRLAVADAIRSLGLPQDPRPGQDADLPPPAITAAQMHTALAKIDRAKLSPESQARLGELLAWSKQRAEKGIVGESIRVAGFDLQEGDWLLMRNPSPYNHFTNLAPGLFTHVGVVTSEMGEDGIRRFVIVEMPEQSARIPATNVDAYLLRTLHYFFVRHNDPQALRDMSAAAGSMIGNESQFDLHFRTDRVLALKGQPLADRTIHTYCAGFLLLCALQTEHDRESFFPLAESAPNENCQQNLAKLGLAIGDDFISPTGALFSADMEIVARRRPMYEPTREIKEAVYDHFAARVIHDTLTPSPTAYQALRERLAGLSKRNAWLARALARANNVSERMDLESAAKAAAVVETLDEFADGSMNQFIAARRAFFAGPLEALPEQGYTAAQIKSIEAYRTRHSDLWQAWIGRRLSPRDLRLALVEYYVEVGKGKLDERFFAEDTP